MSGAQARNNWKQKPIVKMPRVIACVVISTAILLLAAVLDVGRRGLTEAVQDTLWEDDASMPPPLRVGRDNDFKEQNVRRLGVIF